MQECLDKYSFVQNLQSEKANLNLRDTAYLHSIMNFYTQNTQ